MRGWSVLTIAAAALGCAGGEPAPSADAPPDSVALDTTAVASEDVPAQDALPILPGEGEPRVYRLRLVNRLAEDALVFASATAGRVVLDTVPARDSIHVDIRVRADRIELEAEDEGGRLRAAGALELSGSDLNRWVIIDLAEPTGETRTALVPGQTDRYPRTRSD